MTNFNEILKETLSAVNKAFNTAQKDLQEIATEISNAVKENAGADFDFVMREIRSDVDGVLYRFYFDTDVEDEYADAINISFVHIPQTGYPLSHGSYSFKNKDYTRIKSFADKEELEYYFSNFLKEPESPLIQAIGYAVRKKQKE